MAQSTDDTDGQHFLRRWISLGDVISLALSLCALGVTYGKISTDVQHTNATVESMLLTIRDLQSRDITPGARSQLAAIQATDQALQAQVNELRDELRMQRAELIAEVRLLGEKLDRHDRR